MSDKRRAEIEAKRQKLAELRKARQERQKSDFERRATEVGHPILSIYLHPRSYVATISSLTSDFFATQSAAGPSTSSRRDVDSLINQLVGPEGSGILSPSPRRLRTPDLASPISSTPGTPQFNYGGAGPSGLGFVSGRVSRQSGGSADRYSVGTTLVHAGTDNVVDR